MKCQIDRAWSWFHLGMERIPRTLVVGVCQNEQLDTRAVFGYDADYITFYVGDIDEDEIAIPFIHYVNIDDFAVKATLVGYRNGKATYNLLVK